jgi:hypothetical protein
MWFQESTKHYSPPQQVLAVKIFSVRVNSMPEERTGSKFTWLTPALRSRLKVPQMGAITMVNQYYETEKAVCELIGIISY